MSGFIFGVNVVFGYLEEIGFLARGERADALERKGLVIEPIFSPGRKTSRNPIIRNLERDDIYDVIFVVIRPSEFEESPQKTPLS